MTGAFIHGFLLAIALILPLGPQNTFVLTQGATQPSWRSTWPVVAVAGASDTALILLSVAGVSIVVLAIPVLRLTLSLAGIVFLIYIGYKTWSAPVGKWDGHAADEWPLGRKIRYSLSVSLLNPHAVLDTVVIIGGGSALYTSAADRWIYAASASLVSWLWFFGLSLAGRGLHRIARIPAAALWINRVSGGIMWVVAAKTAWQLSQGSSK